MPLSRLHSILLPVRGDGKGDNAMKHAAILARKHTARLRVVHCRLRTQDLMSYGVVIPKIVRDQIEAAVSQNANATEEQLLQEFRDLAGQFDLAEQDHVPGKATTRFIDYDGKQADAVKYYGRLADLICVPQPDPNMNLGFNTLKSALFSSGRPVMMCPHNDNVADTFTDHVCIGWNGSLEATRAVALAAPIIAHAKSVTILSSGVSDHAATPEQLQRHLELREIPSTIRKFTVTGKNAGTQLLAETKEAGAGLLIMGAYHDSYERESLFGGNSQAVVKESDFPIVLVH